MWPNPQFPTALVTFTEEIRNRKLQFLCSPSRNKDIARASLKRLNFGLKDVLD